MKGLLLFCLACAALPAAANESAPKEADAGACKADAAKLCADMVPGDGKLGPCLKSHKDELSPECREKFERHRQGGKRMEKGGQGACKADSEKLCAGMHPGDGKWGPCMKEHKDELSSDCGAKGQPGEGTEGDEDKKDAQE